MSEGMEASLKGALQAALLHPEVSIGNSSLPSGCFGKTGVDSGQLFGWELIMTFVLVMTVYAVASMSLNLLHTCLFNISYDFSANSHLQELNLGEPSLL